MIQKKIPFNTRVTFILFIVFNSLVPIACQTDQNSQTKQNELNKQNPSSAQQDTSKSKKKQNKTQKENDKEQSPDINNASNTIKIDESNSANSTASDAEFEDDNDTRINNTTDAKTAETKPAVSYLKTHADKIIQDNKENKLKPYQIIDAFFLAKNFDAAGNSAASEPLYEICYKKKKTIPVGHALINAKVNLNKMTEAENIAKELSVIFPNDPDPLIYLSNIYQLEGKSAELGALLEKAYKKFDTNEGIVVAYALFNRKNSKQILIHYISKKPTSFNAYNNLIQIYIEEKNFDEAYTYARKMLAYDPDNTETITTLGKIEYSRKNLPAAENYFKTAFEKDLSNNLAAQTYINVLIEEEKYKEAISILTNLEEKSDEKSKYPPEFSYQLARLLIIDQDYQEAIKRLLPLEESHFEVDGTNFYLGLCYGSLKDFDNAFRYLDDVSATSPLYSSAVRLKIVLFIETKQDEVAKRLLAHLPMDSKNFTENVLFKAQVLHYYQDSKNAIDILNNAIAKDPEEKKFYLRKAEILLTSDSSQSGIKELEHIVKKWPNYSEALNFLGYTLTTQGIRLDYAENLLKKAIKLEPNNGFYYDSIGWLYFKKSEYKKAQENMEISISKNIQEPVFLYHYSQLLNQLGNHPKSLQQLEMAKKIISSMLIYFVESDTELKSIAISIDSKIKEAKHKIKRS